MAGTNVNLSPHVSSGQGGAAFSRILSLCLKLGTPSSMTPGVHRQRTQRGMGIFLSSCPSRCRGAGGAFEWHQDSRQAPGLLSGWHLASTLRLPLPKGAPLAVMCVPVGCHSLKPRLEQSSQLIGKLNPFFSCGRGRKKGEEEGREAEL